jgi:hypothetical protein
MSAVIDSKMEMLDEDEIISIAAQETDSPYSPEQVRAAVLAEAHGTGALIIRQGNTLFVVNKNPNNPKAAVFRALNADTASNYIKNSIEFIKAIKMAGYEVLVTDFNDESILSIFRYISRNPPFPDMGYAVQRLSDGGYRATIKLGNNNSGGGLQWAQ